MGRRQVAISQANASALLLDENRARGGETPMLNRSVIAVSAIAVLMLGPIATRADVVLDWNEIMLSTFANQSPPVNPLAGARLAAITQLAVFDAVNAIEQHYEPYLEELTAPPVASAEAAAVAAAHGVLTHYFHTSGASLDRERAISLAAILDGHGKVAGIAVGEAAAAAMIERRANDGSAPPQFHLPSSSDPGEWQLTSSCSPSGGVFVHWRELTPFGIKASRHFRSPPPPTLGSDEYARDYNEVKLVGGVNSGERPPDRATVAQFYNVVLAVGVWNPSARQVAAARDATLSENARALALLNMAISDALAAVMETKYHYRFWRPETAIAAGDRDGNQQTQVDAGFAPYITSPCFPGYPSAHASASYAGRAVLEEIYGKGPHAITLSSPALAGVPLQYGSFAQITDDIDDARVYGGIHFRFEQEVGASQGTRVGKDVLSHNLRSVDHHEQ
jgi:hypothetical protein